MSAARFHVSATNPNDQIGGGGCLCSPTKTDCVGPYAVFYGTETDSNVSPHVVVSLACAKAVVDQAENGELLNVSADVIDSTAVPFTAEEAALVDEIVAAREPLPENPSFDDDELLDALADEDIPEL
jgi:hypothetical protein